VSTERRETGGMTQARDQAGGGRREEQEAGYCQETGQEAQGKRREIGDRRWEGNEARDERRKRRHKARDRIWEAKGERQEAGGKKREVRDGGIMREMGDGRKEGRGKW
jgi:hypothetical protein